MSYSPSSSPAEPCPLCGLVLDVSGMSLFFLVKCPQCHSEVRVRSILGHYELLGILGHGGSSIVFRARVHGEAGEQFALKVLDRNHPDYEENLIHLKNEVLFARQLDHPRVVKIFDLQEDEFGARLSMEVMEGGSLHDQIDSGEKISELRILETGLEILKALSAACAKGIIHRDLKPANILFSASGGAKLADFGLACLLSSKSAMRGDIMATPDYVAPEIISGKGWDFRSDLYGLGGCLYHAFTGHPPHKTEGEALQQLRVIKRHPVHLSWKERKLLPETAALINRMLLPDPENRFDSYEELETAFLAALDRLAKSKSNVTPGLQRFLAPFRGRS